MSWLRHGFFLNVQLICRKHLYIGSLGPVHSLLFLFDVRDREFYCPVLH